MLPVPHPEKLLMFGDDGIQFVSFLLMISHTCSIGDKSRNLEGQGGRLI